MKCLAPNLIQYLATLSGSFSILSSGINLGWTSPYLPKLLDPASPIPTTNEEGLWCAVMALVGAPVGAIFAAIFADKIGRKNTILAMAPVMFGSLVMTAYAQSILTISIARFANGAVEGGLYTVLPIYIAEISSPNIRGFLTSTIDVATITGTLFINAIGPFTSIFESSWICTIVPLFHFFTFIWVPETPYYHLKKNNHDEAKKSIRALRGTKDIDLEFTDLCNAVSRQESNEKSSFKDMFLVKSNWRACCIYMIISVSNKFSGNNPLLFYTTTIFQAAETNIDPTLSVIIYCVVRLIGTISALFVVDRFGRRPLMMFSASGCAFFLFFEGLYFYLKDFQPELVANLNWLPITALLGYNVVFSLGLSYGPVLFLGELFPTNIKAIALCLADTFSVVMGTIASKYFQATMDSFGLFVPFWSFALYSALGFCLIVKFVPETKGKTLEEIQLYLINK